MRVYSEPCKNCLLSKNSIVSPKRIKEIIKGCTKKQTFFTCHKASMNDEEICCKTFYDTLGHVSQLIRIAERLKCVKVVKMPKHEKLLTYKELQNGN